MSTLRVRNNMLGGWLQPRKSDVDIDRGTAVLINELVTHSSFHIKPCELNTSLLRRSKWPVRMHSASPMPLQSPFCTGHSLTSVSDTSLMRSLLSSFSCAIVRYHKVRHSHGRCCESRLSSNSPPCAFHSCLSICPFNSSMSRLIDQSMIKRREGVFEARRCGTIVVGNGR